MNDTCNSMSDIGTNLPS